MDYCTSCFFIFKTLESCPRAAPFEVGALSDKLLEAFWVLGSLQPFFIFIGLFSYILLRKSSRCFFLLLCVVFMTFLNEVIFKKIVQQKRPEGACSTSFGFPSGHSAFAGTLISWLILEWSIFHEKAPFKSSGYYAIVRNLGIITTPLTPLSRYILNYHTPLQIIVGFVLGLLWSMLFMWMVISMYRNHRSCMNAKIVQGIRRIGLNDNFMNMNIERSSLLDDESLDPSKESLIDAIESLPLKDKVKNMVKKKKAGTIEMKL